MADPCPRVSTRSPARTARTGPPRHDGTHVRGPVGLTVEETRRHYPCDDFGRLSPRRLLDLPAARVGEDFTSAGGRTFGPVLSLDPGRQPTGTIVGAHLSSVLEAEVRRVTRLLLKVVMQSTRIATALSVDDLVMARRQVPNLTRLAEAPPGDRTP